MKIEKTMNQQFSDRIIVTKGQSDKTFVPLNGFWPLRGVGGQLLVDDF